MLFFGITDSAAAAPRSKLIPSPSTTAPESADVAPVSPPSGYLQLVGPGRLELVAPAVVTRGPEPTYPPSEVLARDPEAYAAMEAERRATPAGVTPPSKSDALTLSVGGELLPEVSVSPYSRARVHPEDVILFFKDEKLDGLGGGIAYPAARLRFDPARPEVRTSSSATYTTQ